MIGIKAREVASFELFGKRGCQFFKGRSVFNVIIRYARYLYDFCRYRLFRIDILVCPFLRSVGVYLNIRYLYYPVFNKIKPRCLKIEDNEGLR